MNLVLLQSREPNMKPVQLQFDVLQRCVRAGPPRCRFSRAGRRLCRMLECFVATYGSMNPFAASYVTGILQVKLRAAKDPAHTRKMSIIGNRQGMRLERSACSAVPAVCLV